MKLLDLDPHWVGAGGEGVTRHDPATGAQVPVPRREGIGVSFECPCGCAIRCYVPFANPLDGGPQEGTAGWQRTGDTFETLTLTPSIHRIAGCAKSWHGFITNGEVTTV